MLTGIVLIEVESRKIPEAAAAIANIDRVDSVFSVTGDVDLIALVRVEQHEDFATVIADKVSKVDGVEGTKTYLAFREYSQDDLEVAFDLGFTD